MLYVETRKALLENIFGDLVSIKYVPFDSDTIGSRTFTNASAYSVGERAWKRPVIFSIFATF